MAIIDGRFASTTPMIISPTFGTVICFCRFIDADLSEESRLICPIVVALIESLSSNVLSPGRYSSIDAIFSPGIFWFSSMCN